MKLSFGKQSEILLHICSLSKKKMIKKYSIFESVRVNWNAHKQLTDKLTAQLR